MSIQPYKTPRDNPWRKTIKALQITGEVLAVLAPLALIVFTVWFVLHGIDAGAWKEVPTGETKTVEVRIKKEVPVTRSADPTVTGWSIGLIVASVASLALLVWFTVIGWRRVANNAWEWDRRNEWRWKEKK